MNCTCPNCKVQNTYLGNIYSSSTDTGNTRPYLSIEPAKYKFTLIEKNWIKVEKVWGICGDCGLVWTIYDPELISMKIKKWLKGESILGTTTTKCVSCKSNCLSWELHGPEAWPCEMRIEFIKAKFKLTLNTSPVFDIEQRVTLCPMCRIMFSKADSSEVKKKITLFEPVMCK